MISGTVTLKLYKGNMITDSRTSPHTLYGEGTGMIQEAN